MNQLRTTFCVHSTLPTYRDALLISWEFGTMSIQDFFEENTIPTELRTSFVFIKKPTGDGLQGTVRKPIVYKY